MNNTMNTLWITQYVTPDLAGTETLHRHIYASQKRPHVYTLSISTGKNQSTEARGALYILT